MIVRVDDLRGPEIAALLHVHLAYSAGQSPAESDHALDLDSLRAPDITVWTAWDGEELLGCGALKELDRRHGEIKSMHTAAAHRGRGVGKAILERILAAARDRAYRRVSLETGSSGAYDAARKLYERCGFVECGSFGSYRDDPHSVFMTLSLDAESGGPSTSA